MTRAAQWIGPRYSYAGMYNGVGPFVDFYFVCRVDYETSVSRPDDDDVFNVFLTFDSRLSTVNKTTTSSTSLDVVFTSQDMADGFGTKV